MKILAATVAYCDICEAKFRRPLPNGWTVTTYQVGSRNYVQAHLPTCPAGYPKTEVPDEVADEA